MPRLGRPHICLSESGPQARSTPLVDYGEAEFEGTNWRMVKFRSVKSHPNFVFHFHHIPNTGTGAGSDGQRIYECIDCKKSGSGFSGPSIDHVIHFSAVSGLREGSPFCRRRSGECTPRLHAIGKFVGIRTAHANLQRIDARKHGCERLGSQAPVRHTEEANRTTVRGAELHLRRPKLFHLREQTPSG